MSVDNVWERAGPGGAQVAASLDAPVLAVASTDGEAGPSSGPRCLRRRDTLFPARERHRRAAADASAVRRRLELAQVAGPGERPRVIVGSLQALIQPIPRLRDLQAEFVQLASGDVLDVNKLLARLVRAGYPREPLVEAAGQVACAGTS